MKYVVRVGAAIEQCAGDRDRVFVHGGERKPGEAEVEERCPAFRTPVLHQKVAAAPGPTSRDSLRRVTRSRELRAFLQVVQDAGQIAADDTV